MYHSEVGLYPRTFAASAVIWIEMLPQVLAIIGLFLWANSWRDGWVSYAWEPALWRLLQLSPGVPPSPATHAILAQSKADNGRLKAGETVYQAGELSKTL